MTSNQPIAPYRTAAPRAQEPRPLAPEQEMRLLLDAASMPRGVQAWFAVASALFGAAILVWNGLHVGALVAALYVTLPASTALGRWVRHRLRLARLRRQGFDVAPATEHLRIALEPRVRIDPALDVSCARVSSDERSEARLWARDESSPRKSRARIT